MLFFSEYESSADKYANGLIEVSHSLQSHLSLKRLLKPVLYLRGLVAEGVPLAGACGAIPLALSTVKEIARLLFALLIINA